MQHAFGTEANQQRRSNYRNAFSVLNDTISSGEKYDDEVFSGVVKTAAALREIDETQIRLRGMHSGLLVYSIQPRTFDLPVCAAV